MKNLPTQTDQPKKITVLMVDDNVGIRKSLCAILEAEGNFEIIGQAKDGRKAVAMAHTLRPDVILMDIAMPVLNGLEATLQIIAANPLAKVLILSAHDDDAYLKRGVEIGAMGFLQKLTASEILAGAIREVVKGKFFFSPAIAKRMAADSWK